MESRAHDAALHPVRRSRTMPDAHRPPTSDSPPVTRSAKRTTWLKRFGVAGFLFFLVKGLLWLMLPAALVFFGC